MNHVNGNEEVKRKINHVCKIKGVDVLTIAIVIAETNGFMLFRNMAQLVSYAGYDVIENQSGNTMEKLAYPKRETAASGVPCTCLHLTR